MANLLRPASDDVRTPVWLKCRRCDVRWIAAYLPMPMATFARLMKRAACPVCGIHHEDIYLSDPGPAPPGAPDS